MERAGAGKMTFTVAEMTALEYKELRVAEDPATGAITVELVK